MIRKGDSQELEAEVLRHMPVDVMQALQQSDRHEPLVKHLVQSAITRYVTGIDQRTLQALTAKIMAGTAAVKAVTEAKRAVHELSHLDQKLQEEEELAGRRHETRLMEEQETQSWLTMGEVARWHLSAKLQAEIRKFELQYRLAEEPAQGGHNRWEALLAAWQGDVTGAEDFAAQTDEWLTDYRERRGAQVAADDPRRGEKLAAIEVLVDDLRARRDRMIREGWDFPLRGTSFGQ